MSDYFDKGPFIHVEDMKKNASITQLLQRHETRMKMFLKNYPDVQCPPVSTLADIDKANNHTIKLKTEYRKSINYISPEELRLMLGKHYNRFGEKVIEKIHILAQIEELKNIN